MARLQPVTPPKQELLDHIVEIVILSVVTLVLAGFVWAIVATFLAH